MICRRYENFNSFNPKPYWQIKLKHRKDYLNLYSTSALKWEDKKQGERILKILEGEDTATVINVSTDTLQELSPLLFNLGELQREANRKLGLSAVEVLNSAHRLYEKKFITYPQSSSQYIAKHLWADIPELIRLLNQIDTFRPAISNLKFGNFNKRIVNSQMVKDHHGILPTTTIPSALTAIEKAVYDMIFYRLLESLSEHCSKKISHITLKANHFEFNVTGSIVVNKGWRAIRGILSNEANIYKNDS